MCRDYAYDGLPVRKGPCPPLHWHGPKQADMQLAELQETAEVKVAVQPLHGLDVI